MVLGGMPMGYGILSGPSEEKATASLIKRLAVVGQSEKLYEKDRQDTATVK
jgi:hypothetical protein